MLSTLLSACFGAKGLTPGKVNKLKTLKRVMYGRAGFALLRQRLLHDA
jgi:transposase